MANFDHSTARIAAWNLAGYWGLSTERLAYQVEGLALLDAEVIALVEIKPASALESLKQGLAEKGVEYESSMIEQASDLNIGVLYKKGIVAWNAHLLEGSDFGDPRRRKAFILNMRIGKFDFKLIVVHLKSGRGADEQEIRDQQAQIIGTYITQQRQASREDILLVGDFNMIPGQDVSNFHHLGGEDLMDFVSSWDLQERFSHILPAGRANLLDGFAISRTYSTEYIRGSLRVFPIGFGRESPITCPLWLPSELTAAGIN